MKERDGRDGGHARTSLGPDGEERRNAKRVLQRKLILCKAFRRPREKFPRRPISTEKSEGGRGCYSLFLFNAASPIWPLAIHSRGREAIPPRARDTGALRTNLRKSGGGEVKASNQRSMRGKGDRQTLPTLHLQSKRERET